MRTNANSNLTILLTQREKTMAEAETFTIDGEEYAVASLSAKGRECVESVKFVDNELEKLKARIAVLSTARAAYFFTLKDEMAKKAN